MTIIGTAHVHIRADDKYFESDVRKATAKIKNVTIQLKADVDLAKASKKIRDLRYRITSKDAVLKVDANVAKAEEKMSKLLAKFLNKDVEFKAVANTAAANTALSEIATRYASKRVPFVAQADTKAANAALRSLSRARTANFRAIIDPAAQRALTGLFNTLTGTLDGRKIKATLTGLAANFEGLATKAIIATAAITALGGALLTTGANILSIGGDITKVIGLSALVPAAIGSMASIMVANKMAWKGFGEAFSDDAKKAAEALAKLPPEAQKAVKALKGTYTEIQKPVQNAFWKEMGTSLQDTVKYLVPQLKTGLSSVGVGWAKVISETLQGFKRLGDNNGLGRMLENVGQMLTNMSAGMGPLIDAFNTLGSVGATYLPQFGTWLADISKQFENYIAVADDQGRINQWIESGVRTLREMGSVIKSTTGIFSGLTAAARISGAPGLTEMAASLRNIRDIVNGEPFQSRLVTVLEGAREGTERLGDGFRRLTDYIGESSVGIGIFLQTAGELGGLGFESIRTLFDGTGLGGGLENAMLGMKDMLKNLQTGFGDLGTSIGILGTISGELFRNMAPGLNQLFETIRMVLQELQQGVLDAMPVFNEFIQAILAIAQGPVVALADGIGNLLELFADLPSGIQTAIMALGLFLLLKPKFDNFFLGIRKNFSDMDSESGQRMRNVTNSWNKMTTGLKSAWDGFPASAEHAMVQTDRAIRNSMDSAAKYVPDRVKDMAAGIKDGFSTLKSGLFAGFAGTAVSELAPVRTGFEDLRRDLSQKAADVRKDWSDNLSRIGDAVAPAGSRVREFGQTVSNMAREMDANLAPAREAWTNLGNHANTVARNTMSSIGGGMRDAGRGLFEAIGGGWGAALGVATMALGLYAAALAESDARVKSFAGSLEQTSGRITAATKKLVAESALSGATNAWDDFFRGVIQLSASVEETLGDLGISFKDYTEAISDPSGRDAYVKGLETISDAMRDGIPITDEMAAAIGTTKKELEGVTGNSMRHLADKAKGAATELAKAEEETRNLATATGTTTVQAAALAKNMETLTDAASSASDKFSALKQNLDITTGGMRTSRETLRDQQEALLGVGDNIKEIGKKYGGLVLETGKLDAAFAGSLITKDGLFSTATQGAIDFSREMDGVADAILKAGAGELDTVLKKTGDLGAAQAASMEVMRKGTEELRTSLINSGVDATVAQQIISQLGLNPDQLQGALNVDTKDAEHEIMRFEMFKDAVLAKNWEVALAASTDEVKNAILSTEQYKKAYEEGGWEAVVKLKDDTGKGFGDVMAKIALAKDESEITAIIKAEFPDAHVFDNAKKLAEDYGMTDVKATLGITDNATLPIGAANEALIGYNMTPTLDKYLNGVDLATPAAGAATGAIGGWNAIEAMQKPLTAANLTGGTVVEAQSTINGLHGVVRDLEAFNATGQGTAESQATLDSLRDVVRNLEGNNATLPELMAAQATIDRLRGKDATLSATDKASEVVRNVNNAKLNDKSFNIMGVLTGVSDAVRRALGFANGGIISGAGVQTFANGGIQMPNVKQYANGGTENHVAQIARGAWPVRIWAEPETGGEAYVPLHPSKRKRSLQILEEVADTFGYSLYKKFANGGMMVESKTPSVVSNSSVSQQTIMGPTTNASGPTVITNVYPSAGLNETQVADSVSENIYWKLSTQI